MRQLARLITRRELDTKSSEKLGSRPSYVKSHTKSGAKSDVTKLYQRLESRRKSKVIRRNRCFGAKLCRIRMTSRGRDQMSVSRDRRESTSRFSDDDGSVSS